MKTQRLLTIGHDAKTIKGESKGYQTAILYLSPWKLSGKNLCPFASPGCIATCLNTAGRGLFQKTQKGRLRKTNLFLENPSKFAEYLRHEINNHVKLTKKKGLIPVVRLNGTSDLPWENLDVIQHFPAVQFYDYTKSPERMQAYLEKRLPLNYHLTFSRSELNETECLKVLGQGGTVAIVFRVRYSGRHKVKDPLPQTWNGFPMFDGDDTDLRFLDPVGHMIGLRAKGKARKDTSGFVVNP